MSLHKEISFENEICQQLSKTAGSTSRLTQQAMTAPGRYSLTMCWPGCKPLSPKPGTS